MRLKELATELGLSQTTVSRALNGYPEVSEATRERVNEAARRLYGSFGFVEKGLDEDDEMIAVLELGR